ncbi:hypothetical protein CDL15_Pgr026327 [Punica granatum]|uniref:Uncharacterized protein n=1 Tax=Punica granatum TaxID=22663 RepID=A0A218XW20_PUNGR|nr:hypothetical protein CDL15_Pgr026327 [Punica granatum]PKI51793.1 hypothetical protein CRG98_027841 [Punica granatum]
MREDSSINDYSVPPQLLDFIYLLKDRQNRKDLFHLIPKQIVDTYLLDETYTFHNRYELLNGYLYDLTKLKKAKELKESYKASANHDETLCKAAEAELGQLKD